MALAYVLKKERKKERKKATCKPQLPTYRSVKSQIKFKSSLLRKSEKIQNMMYHCSQLAIAIRGEQWLDTK